MMDYHQDGDNEATQAESHGEDEVSLAESHQSSSKNLEIEEKAEAPAEKRCCEFLYFDDCQEAQGYSLVRNPNFEKNKTGF